MPKKSTTQLTKENKELREALRQKQDIETAKVLSESEPMVPVKNFGGAYLIYPYEYKGVNKRLELDVNGRKQTSAVPLSIWLDIERDTKFVTEGYIARTDEEITNPNIIEDVDKFLESDEEVIRSTIAKITNHNVLYRMHSHVENIEKKTGKVLLALTGVQDRITALTGSRYGEEE